MEKENMIIRLMSIQDYASVYKLWTETAGMSIRSYDDSEEGIAKFIAKNPNSNFVAIKEGEIIGVILCGIDGRRAYIYHTVVNPVGGCDESGRGRRHPQEWPARHAQQ